MQGAVLRIVSNLQLLKNVMIFRRPYRKIAFVLHVHNFYWAGGGGVGWKGRRKIWFPLEIFLKWKFPTTSIVSEEIEHFVAKISLGNNFRFSSKKLSSPIFPSGFSCLTSRPLGSTDGKEHSSAGAL